MATSEINPILTFFLISPVLFGFGPKFSDNTNADPASSARVERVWVPVSFDPDNTERPVVVFGPEQILPDHTYPLVLYFHGYGGTNDVSFVDGGDSGIIDFSDPSKTSNYVHIVYDAWWQLLKEQEVAQDWFLVVIDGRNCMKGTFFIDSRYTGKLGTWATQEVPAYLEAHYNIHFSTDPYKNATAGHSMGGYAALRLSQIYNPSAKEGRVFGIAAANNPPSSWVASSPLILQVQNENERDELGRLMYSYSEEPASISYSEGQKFAWEIERATNLVYAMSAVMDQDSVRPVEPDGGFEPCDPESDGIDFGLGPYGGIEMRDLHDWLENDVAHNIEEYPLLWLHSAIYFDGQEQGFGDEYYLQYNAPYLEHVLAETNNSERWGADKRAIDFVTDYYPNEADEPYYTEQASPGSDVHFFELTYRTLKAFRFISIRMAAGYTD